MKRPRSDSQRFEEAVRWYAEHRPQYENLAQKITTILTEVLSVNSIPYHTITHRAKDISSFGEKAKKKKYDDPIGQTMDLAGIRVVTYVSSEVDQVCELIQTIFEVLPEHCIYKGTTLAVDQFGYRSVHFVAKLTAERLSLPEYSQFHDKYFEIQVRTILEHAWAAISHDRDYKLHGVLAPELKREFASLAAILERTDKDFNNLVRQVDAYARTVREQTELGRLDILIDSASLTQYMTLRFYDRSPSIINPTLNGRDQEIIDELLTFGVETLHDLEEIIPPDYLQVLDEYEDDTNFLGILRDLMIISNAKLYFESVWRGHWKATDAIMVALMSHYGINLRKLTRKYGFIIGDRDDVDQ